jgi:hypothetical protein
MWRTFIIPLIGRIAAVAVGAVLAFVALLKARTIGATMKKMGEAVLLRFRKWVHRKATLGHPQDTTAKRYKGVFQNYWYNSNPRHVYFFCVTHDGVSTTVQILEPNLLAGLKRGTLVEIDTEVVLGHKYEIVKRVRVNHA